MFRITTNTEHTDTTDFDMLHDAATELATKLRSQPTVPPHPQNPKQSWQQLSCGGRLPPVTCAFQGCAWYGGRHVEDTEDTSHYAEHPWDEDLKNHILARHSDEIHRATKTAAPTCAVCRNEWDLYKEACSV